MNIKIPILALTPHGGGRVLVEIANALVQKGWNVTVITSKYFGTMPFIFDEHVIVKKIGPASSNKLICLLSFLLLAPFYLIRSKIIANHFLTVIPSWISATFFGSQYLYLVQDIEHRFFYKKLLWPLKVICKWTYRRGRLVAANSYLSSELNQYNKVLFTLSLGVSNVFFITSEKKSNKIYDVVYFLRKQSHKRIDRFDQILDVLAKRNISVLCISQDIDLLDSYAKKATVIKPDSDVQLIDFIDKARILLLTSDHEGFALPPLEGMARGLPSVMYECGGPGVYATHGENSFIVTDGQSKTALSYIEKLLNEKDCYLAMSKNAKETAIRFSLDKAVDEFTNYIGKKFTQS